MIDFNQLDDLARRLSDLVPPGLRQSREELQSTFKGALQAGLGKLDWSPAKSSTCSARCCCARAKNSTRWSRPWPRWKPARLRRRPQRRLPLPDQTFHHESGAGAQPCPRGGACA